MRKLLVLAFAVALVVPAQAKDITAEDVTSFAAALVGYEAKCGGLPPRSHELMVIMTTGLNPTDAVAAAINQSAVIERWGVTKWCAGMKDIIDMTERNGR
jgi:hypothetical protein